MGSRKGRQAPATPRFSGSEGAQEQVRARIGGAPGESEPAGSTGGAPILRPRSESPPKDPGSRGGVAEVWQKPARRASHWPLGAAPPHTTGIK